MKSTAGTIIIALLLVAALVVGVAITNDGATTRMDSQSQAQVQVAAQESHADIEVARYDAEARIVAAQQEAEAAKEAARQETHRTYLWTGVLPLALVILLAGVIILVVVNWRGRIAYARTTHYLPTTPPPQVVALAQARGGKPVLVNDIWHVERQGKLIARIRQE